MVRCARHGRRSTGIPTARISRCTARAMRSAGECRPVGWTPSQSAPRKVPAPTSRSPRSGAWLAATSSSRACRPGIRSGSTSPRNARVTCQRSLDTQCMSGVMEAIRSKAPAAWASASAEGVIPTKRRTFPGYAGTRAPSGVEGRRTMGEQLNSGGDRFRRSVLWIRRSVPRTSAYLVNDAGNQITAKKTQSEFALAA